MSAQDSSDASDPQRAKQIAAAAYNYEADPRWADYWSNVLVPPHLASRPDVIDHFKRKFYKINIDPDLVIEPMSAGGYSQPISRSSARTSAPSSSNDARSGSNSRAPSQPSTQPERAANALRLDGRSIRFSINTWVLVVAIVGIFPLVPKHLANRAYQMSFAGTICSSVYSVYRRHGKPSAWTMPAIQTWLQSAIATKDFLHLVYCLVMFTSRLHFKVALVPVICWALDYVARFLRRNVAHSSLYRKYLEEPCLWVETNNATLSILGSNAEIALGFLLIISLFSPQRNIVQAFIYWQLLKLMYQAPVTSAYHQSVWARIGRAVNPYINRYAPFLNTPISAAQRWWFR